MSFLQIKDPKKRDQIVADYVATIRQIQERNEDEKSTGLAKKVELEQTFEPIVKATEKAAKEITDQLPNNLPPVHSAKTTKKTWDETSKETVLEYYLKDKTNLDKYFGIQVINDKFVIGDKNIEVYNNSDLAVDGKNYKGTPGLWRLIMTKNPTDFTDDDLKMYKDLAIRTELHTNPHAAAAGTNGRPTATNKWKMLEKILPPEEGGKKKGEGVFLPGDIKGLTTKLNFILAEFRAGNTSTRNEIVFILDELLRRKRISRKEYTEINSFLVYNDEDSSKI